MVLLAQNGMTLRNITERKGKGERSLGERERDRERTRESVYLKIL